MLVEGLQVCFSCIFCPSVTSLTSFFGSFKLLPCKTLMRTTEGARKEKWLLDFTSFVIFPYLLWVSPLGSVQISFICTRSSPKQPVPSPFSPEVNSSGFSLGFSFLFTWRYAIGQLHFVRTHGEQIHMARVELVWFYIKIKGIKSMNMAPS